MNEQTRIEIRQALEQLDRATDIKGVAVLAMVMPHGTRGTMDVQVLTRGASEQYVAHKLYECMRCSELLPLNLTNIVMTAAAKWLAEQPEAAKAAFDSTVEKCRRQWRDTEEMKAVLQDCRQVIDEYNATHEEED